MAVKLNCYYSPKLPSLPIEVLSVVYCNLCCPGVTLLLNGLDTAVTTVLLLFNVR